MYDIIGDIHGYAEPLKRLLEKMDYQDIGGVWQHPGRQVIFVGDYIDRGPAIRETLQIVKGMADADHAVALMGNHEYNALAYAFCDGKDYLRKHDKKHIHQQRETEQQFEQFPEEWKMYLAWFKSLPLYFEKGLRVVHACWDLDDIRWLKDHKIVSMTNELLIASHKKSSNGKTSKEYDVIDETLKGKEILLPKGGTFFDKDGQKRNKARYKWWMNSHNQKNKNFLFHCPPSLEEVIWDGKIVVEYPLDSPPVFFGHYWLHADPPSTQASNVICLDYSIADKGKLVAYRWNPGEEINNKNFRWTVVSE